MPEDRHTLKQPTSKPISQPTIDPPTQRQRVINKTKDKLSLREIKPRQRLDLYPIIQATNQQTKQQSRPLIYIHPPTQQQRTLNNKTTDKLSLREIKPRQRLDIYPSN